MLACRWSILPFALAVVACRRAAPQIECGPGGRCAGPLDEALGPPMAFIGLEELRRSPQIMPDREVRIWQIFLPQHAGRLTRFTVAGDTVLAQRFEWWRAGDSVVSERRRQGGSPYCISPERDSSDFSVCEVRGAGMPYSANILRMLDSAGLLTLGGGAPPTPADTMPDCRGDVCAGPVALVIENRTPHRYRTYGYTLRMQLDSASRRALRIWVDLDPPAFP